jgi:hypothetical protein
MCHFGSAVKREEQFFKCLCFLGNTVLLFVARQIEVSNLELSSQSRFNVGWAKAALGLPHSEDSHSLPY